MIKPRRLLLGSTLALGVLLPLSAAAWLFWEDQPLHRLPNGAEMRLTTVQYGATRPIVYGPVWKRRLFALAPVLPFNLSRWIGWVVQDPGRVTAPNALTLGLAYHGPTSQHPQGDLIDSHGCRYGALVNLLGPSNGSSSRVQAFPFFPRREASFQFETCLREKERMPTGTFTLPNPARTRHPAWEPQRLPITHRDGPLEVTLLAAERGWSPGRQRLARGDDVPFTKLSYRLGDRSRDWAPAGATLRDATGGSHRFDFNDWRQTPGALFVRGDNLCREEPAYEYELEFSRAAAPGAPPDRTQDLTVVMPSTRIPTLLRFQNGMKLIVHRNDRNDRTSVVALLQPGAGEVARLSMLDRQGHPLAPDRPPSRSVRASNQLSRWTLPKIAKQARLRLQIYKSRFVTFRVKPRWLAPANQPATTTTAAAQVRP